MLYLQLFISFFKIGVFGFGGGLAILSIIQNEVMAHGWLTTSEFIDIVAISQITPGPISINCATYVGYSVTHSILGALVSSVALITPGLILLVFICLIFNKIQDKFKTNSYYQNVMNYLRFIIIGLILAAVIVLVNEKTFGDRYSVAIFFAAVLVYIIDMIVPTANRLGGVIRWVKNPIFVILLSGLIGLLLYA